MTLLLTATFFVLGLIIGSFLNVVIYRLNTSRSLGGRSACMTCQRRLPWYELIPLFSFFLLQGRCRTCKIKISIQYPLVELTTGIIFTSLFCKFQDILLIDKFIFSITYAYYAVMFSILVVIAVYDLKHKIIPDVLSLVFGLLSFIGLFFFHNNVFSDVASFSWSMPHFFDFLSGFLIALPFASFWLVSSGKWMGLGDAKLALGLGWLLGLTFALSSLVIAFWSGAIIGVILIILSKNRRTNRIGMKSEIPFAPFLVLGAFLAFILELNLFNF